jgi:myo-inositol-1(or 4)-monophosphatase
MMYREPIFWNTQFREVESALDEASRDLRRYWASHLAMMPQPLDFDDKSCIERIADTEEDRFCYITLKSRLEKFGLPIVAEDILCSQITALPAFLLDPLDGTHNALMGYPAYTASVALFDADGNVVFAWVYDLSRDITYLAVKGKGALIQSPLTIRRLTTSSRDKLTSLGISVMRHRSENRALDNLIRIARKVRMSSCSSLDLCLIATGALDAFLDLNSPGHERTCDIAAAALVLQEAGGTILNPDGSERQLARPGPLALNDYSGLVAVGDKRCAPILVSYLKMEDTYVSNQFAPEA